MCSERLEDSQRRSIVIITSEFLNPEHVIDSAFELTQAVHLKRAFDVAIISVNILGSLESILKSMAKLLMGKSMEVTGADIIRMVHKCARSALHLPFRGTWVNHYVIEGVNVYEGVGFSIRSPRNFEQQSRFWVKTGLGAFAWYLRRNPRPKMIFSHGRFLVAGSLALEIRRKYNIQYTYAEYCTFYREGKAPEESLPILNDVLDSASAFICISPGVLHDVEHFLNRKLKDAVITPISMDRIFEGVLPTPHSGDAEFVFTSVAFLHSRKRHDIVIRAFKEAFNGDRRFKLNICGDGPLLEQLHDLTRFLGLEQNVRFLGKKTKYEILRLLDNSDSFVLASKDETLGVAIIEALSRGLPVVATTCGGPEYIVNDSCGILVQPDNVQQLAAALRKIVRNYSKYDREGIRRYALANYGGDVALNSAESVYNSAMQRPEIVPTSQ